MKKKKKNQTGLKNRSTESGISNINIHHSGLHGYLMGSLPCKAAEIMLF